MSKRVSLLIAVIVGVLGGTLVTGGALVASSAGAPATTSTTSAASTASAKNCAWKKLPAKLRADLLAARALPVGQRRPAVKKIVKAARAGAYGKRVQQVMERRIALRKAIHKRLPATLRADLKKARHLPVGERKPALKQIRKDALGGKYGVQVQRLAEARKAHRAACHRARTADKSDSTA